MPASTSIAKIMTKRYHSSPRRIRASGASLSEDVMTPRVRVGSPGLAKKNDLVDMIVERQVAA